MNVMLPWGIVDAVLYNCKYTKSGDECNASMGYRRCCTV